MKNVYVDTQNMLRNTTLAFQNIFYAI